METYKQPRQHIKKQTHYFANKDPSSQRYGFPVVMDVYESWTIKKVECQRIDAFELWCWRRLLRVPWTARRSNQSILKEISPGCSLEGLMLKLKLLYFGLLMPRSDSWEKTLVLGKVEGVRRKRWQSMRWFDGIPTHWTWVNSRCWWWTGRPGVLQSMVCQSRIWLSDWTELNWWSVSQYVCNYWKQ